MAEPFAIFTVNRKLIGRRIRFTMQKSLIMSTNLRAKSCVSTHGSAKEADGTVAFSPFEGKNFKKIFLPGTAHTCISLYSLKNVCGSDLTQRTCIINLGYRGNKLGKSRGRRMIWLKNRIYVMTSCNANRHACIARRYVADRIFRVKSYGGCHHWPISPLL